VAAARRSKAKVELAGTVNTAVVAGSGAKLFLDGTLGDDVDVLAGATATLAGVSGSGAVAVNGGAISALSANASFTGAVTLTSGTIDVSATDNVLGTGTLELQGGLLKDASKKTLTLENPLTVAGAADVSATEGMLVFNKAVTVSGVCTLTLTAVSRIEFVGAFNGSGGSPKLTLNGTGTGQRGKFLAGVREGGSSHVVRTPATATFEERSAAAAWRLMPQMDAGGSCGVHNALAVSRGEPLIRRRYYSHLVPSGFVVTESRLASAVSQTTGEWAVPRSPDA